MTSKYKHALLVQEFLSTMDSDGPVRDDARPGLVHTKRFSKSVERSQVFPFMHLLTPSVRGARGSGGWRNGASSALGGNWWKTGTVRPIPTDTIIVVKNKRPGGLNGYAM